MNKPAPQRTFLGLRRAAFAAVVFVVSWSVAALPAAPTACAKADAPALGVPSVTASGLASQVSVPKPSVAVKALASRTVADASATSVLAAAYTASGTAKVTSAKVTVKKLVGKKYKTVAKNRASYPVGLGKYKVTQVVTYRKATKASIDPASGLVTVHKWSKKRHVKKRSSALKVTVAVDPNARPIRVASFNVRNGTLDSDAHSWANRRTAVAQTILSQRPDVVGLQEAEYTPVTVNGTSVHQYEDLLGLVGGSYRITSGLAPQQGCDALSADDTSCFEYSAGMRVFYNSATLTLLNRGVASLTSADHARFAVWAVFQQNANGRRFLFVNTHLAAGVQTSSGGKCVASERDPNYAVRKTQAGEVVSAIRTVAAGLPVVLVGDMNSNKFACPDNGPYHVFTAAGLVDPLGNIDRLTSAGHPTAVKQIHTQFDSANHFAAAPKRHPWPLGTNVDYIWVSKSITTLEYETVVRTTSSGDFATPIPSDHNMLRATITVPAG